MKSDFDEIFGINELNRRVKMLKDKKGTGDDKAMMKQIKKQWNGCRTSLLIVY